MTLTRCNVKVKVTGLLNLRKLAKPCMHAGGDDRQPPCGAFWLKWVHKSRVNSTKITRTDIMRLRHISATSLSCTVSVLTQFHVSRRFAVTHLATGRVQRRTTNLSRLWKAANCFCTSLHIASVSSCARSYRSAWKPQETAGDRRRRQATAGDYKKNHRGILKFTEN